MRFRVLDKKGEDVLGGPINEDNAYIRAYPEPLDGEKHPLKLDVGEVTHVCYSLSGSKGYYLIIRDS